MRIAEAIAAGWMHRARVNWARFLQVNSVFVLSLVGFSSIASAGDMTGVIRQVHLGPIYGTKVFLKIDGTATNQPSCQTSTGYEFVFDADSPTGRALLSTAIAAQVSGQTVKLNGYNECTLFGNVEDLRWLSLGT